MADEIEVRREKLEALRSAGVDPYPATVQARTRLADVLASFAEGQTHTLAGRIMTIRVHGGLLFADVFDGSGRLQIALKEDVSGSESFALFRDRIDPGDFVEVSGELFLTKRGEQTLLIKEWRILGKALLPLPEKWHGLVDVEQRYRKRYLDLLMNDEVRQRMHLRSKVITAMRAFFDGQGFTEVETPTLQPIYGGGFARPFTTHYNALSSDFYLRISDEMYLKRLLVGGFERVYEITKVFRNEGIDRDHNPEFTMFEAQIAYADYRFGMDLFEQLFAQVAQTVLGTTAVVHGDVTVELQTPWKRLRLVDAVREIGGVDVASWSSVAEARKELAKHIPQKSRQTMEHMQTVGELIAFAFEELVEEKLIQPTMIYDYPVEVSPLAKKSADPRFTERFEVFALGSEIGNNYSELNDPQDLHQRFIEEKKREAAGFDEAHQTDWDYLAAIMHGMPPACGLGIGVDRMVMLLSGAATIKEVILFPTLKPLPEDEARQEAGV